MAMKCIDQMPPPIAVAAAVIQAKRRQRRAGQMRAATSSETKDAIIATPTDRATSEGLYTGSRKEAPMGPRGWSNPLVINAQELKIPYSPPAAAGLRPSPQKPTPLSGERGVWLTKDPGLSLRPSSTSGTRSDAACARRRKPLRI